MKKLFLLLSILTVSVLSTGCNQYFVAEMTGSNGDVYYGSFNRRDMVQSDVKLYKKNSPMTCDGIMFLYNPARGYNLGNSRTTAKMVLGCNDGTVIDTNWQLRKHSYKDGFGDGVDQFNNKFTFKTISKYDFEQNVKREVKFVNDKTTNYYLKY